MQLLAVGVNIIQLIFVNIAGFEMVQLQGFGFNGLFSFN